VKCTDPVAVSPFPGQFAQEIQQTPEVAPEANPPSVEHLPLDDGFQILAVPQGKVEVGTSPVPRFGQAADPLQTLAAAHATFQVPAAEQGRVDGQGLPAGQRANLMNAAGTVGCKKEAGADAKSVGPRPEILITFAGLPEFTDCLVAAVDDRVQLSRNPLP